MYPLDTKTKEGTLFWSLPKRAPTPTAFDKEDMLHCTFIASLACLRATVFYIAIPTKTPRTEEFRKHCGEVASQVKVAEFKPNEAKAKEIQAEISKADQDKEESKQEPEQEEAEEVIDQDSLEKQKEQFIALLKTLPIKKDKKIEEYLIKAEDFEKDEDANFHIDFMYSMGMCRCRNYKLTEMDWLTVKLKAGRIVAALATTTACVAGL